MVKVRRESSRDISRVRQINKLAFESPVEATIVDSLRHSCPDLLSLVTEKENVVVGHILFSPAVINRSDGPDIEGMGLAPMAVHPDSQRQGIGSRLVERGLEILRKQGCPFVVVLGHPEYYPRFGFKPASQFGLTCQWDGVPDAAFMVLIMDKGKLDGVSGVIKYRNEFDDAI